MNNFTCPNTADLQVVFCIDMHSCVRADVHVLQGNTPLLLAVHRNQPKIVAVLLSTRSPNINATDKEVHAFLVTSPGSKPPVSMHRMSTSLQSYGFYRSGCCPLKSSGNHSHTALLEKQCRWSDYFKAHCG